MTEQSAQTKDGGKGYNLKVTPVSEIERSTTASNTKKIKFRGTYISKGKPRELTVVAQGIAYDKIDELVEQGVEIGLRCLFKRAPANDNGRGGEYLAVIDLPLPPKQKAA